jgi:hypothetical protein
MSRRLPATLSVLLVWAAVALVVSHPAVAHGRLLPRVGEIGTSIPAAADRLHSAGASGSGQLIFVENVGQFDPQARFQVRIGSVTLFFTEQDLWYSLPQRSQGAVDRADGEGNSTESPLGLNVRVSFVGANPRPIVRGFDRLSTAVSYFKGRDEAVWHVNVPVWGGVRYEDLYPGVDLEITSQDGFLVQRVVALHGADRSVVKLRVDGLEALTGPGSLGRQARDACINPAGFGGLPGDSCGDSLSGEQLLLASSTGEFLLPLLTVEGHRPEEAPTVASVGPGSFEVSGLYVWPLSSGVSLQSAGQYDVYGLGYSTFLGGAGYEAGTDIAVDSSGAVYVTGATISSDFPTTTGAFDTEQNGGTCGSAPYTFTCPDVFVTKLNEDGTMAYSTFLGGAGADLGVSLAVNGSGEVYVTGSTTSDTDFPIKVGAFDTDHNGGTDAFLTKLNAAGTSLDYSTFLGGSAADAGSSITVDSSGYAYLTGSTGSADFPHTEGAFDTTHNGGTDAFVAKLSPAGDEDADLIYSTFLGGGNSDSGAGIAVDSFGSAYLTGATASDTFTTTVGAFQRTFGGGTCGSEPDTYPCADVFVTKLSADGSLAVYSTFLGGISSDSGADIALDNSGDACVTGSTGSSDFPYTESAFDTTHNGGTDAFVAKLTPAGGGATDLMYATFFGGSQADSAASVALGDSGSAYVTGGTISPDLPTTPGALDPSYHGGTCWRLTDPGPCTDAFVVKLSADGMNLDYGTYFAGGSDDAGVGIAVDDLGSVYVTGGTGSGDLPTTEGAPQTIFAGGFDSFVTKLAPLKEQAYVPLSMKDHP